MAACTAQILCTATIPYGCLTWALPLALHLLQLNTAYSAHEIVGDYMTAVLKWFESGGAGNLTQLAEVCVWRWTSNGSRGQASCVCVLAAQGAAGHGGKPSAGCCSLMCLPTCLPAPHRRST